MMNSSIVSNRSSNSFSSMSWNFSIFPLVCGCLARDGMKITPSSWSASWNSLFALPFLSNLLGMNCVPRSLFSSKGATWCRAIAAYRTISEFRVVAESKTP